MNLFAKIGVLPLFCGYALTSSVFLLSISSLVQADPGIELVNPSPSGGDRMGYSVDIDGDYAVVGSRLDDNNENINSGSVLIFKFMNNGGWMHHQTLLSPDPGAQFHFGHAVGISGDYIIVGEEKNGSGGFRAGATHLFQRSSFNDQWMSVGSAVTGATRDFLGRSVAIDGSTYIAGILNSDIVETNGGEAFMADFDSSGNITSLGKASASTVLNAGDNLGNSVDISGDYAVVGAFRDDTGANGAGAAYVYYRNEGGPNAWGQVAKLVADAPVALDQFGFSVSISGDTIAIGSRLSDSNAGLQVGSVYIFEGSDSGAGYLDTWTQTKELTASDAMPGDRLGTSVAIDGDRLLSGAVDRDEFGQDAGIVYYFKRDSQGDWEEADALFDMETTIRDEFGISVALDGVNHRAVVGSWLDNRPQNNSGGAYAFSLSKTVFLTSMTYTGDMGAVNGTNAICNNLAGAAGLGGTFKPWLSTGSTSPSTTFVQSTEPYVRVDGVLVALDWDDLIDGQLFAPIVVTEQGSTQPIIGTSGVWSNTTTSGEIDGANHCSNWSHELFGSGILGKIGVYTNADSLWTNAQTLLGCGNTFHLYCFEQ